MGASAAAAMEWLGDVSAALAGASGLEEVLEHALATASKLVTARQVCAFIEGQGHADESISIYRSVPALPEAEMRRLAAQSNYAQCRPGRLGDDVHCFPLQTRGRVMGAILVQGSRGEAEPALTALAAVAAVVLDNFLLCHNEWTRFPNLSAVKPVLARALKDAERALALFFIDIDNFKSVNSKVGYFGGGELLIQLAARLRQWPALRAGWFGHLSGDEFIYVLPLVAGAGTERVMEAAAAIRQAVEAPFCIEGQPVSVTLSMGVSLYPQDARSVEELLAHADQAALDAKRSGKNTCRIYATPPVR